MPRPTFPGYFCFGGQCRYSVFVMNIGAANVKHLTAATGQIEAPEWPLRRVLDTGRTFRRREERPAFTLIRLSANSDMSESA